MNPSRRGFLIGLAAGITAPAIVKIEMLMPIKAYAEDWLPCDGRLISRSLYPALFDVLGPHYGWGRIPNLKSAYLGHAGVFLPTLPGAEYVMSTHNRPLTPTGTICLRIIGS